MRQALLIIDVQPSLTPPQWLIEGIRALIGTLPSVATIERHDESRTPFQKQLGWHPAPDGDSVIDADRIFIKHGDAQSPQTPTVTGAAVQQPRLPQKHSGSRT
ncbi:hypothetical protein PMHK_39330 [Pseudomonas sp. MHK4]|jgi:hypothetical protein